MAGGGSDGDFSDGEEGGSAAENDEDGLPVVQSGKKHLNKTAFALSATKRKNPYLQFEGETDAVKEKLVGLGPGAYVRVLLKGVQCEVCVHMCAYVCICVYALAVFRRLFNWQQARA